VGLGVIESSQRLGLRYDRTERATIPLLRLACIVIINTRRLIKTESWDQVLWLV
jgi:hypothetical protein